MSDRIAVLGPGLCGLASAYFLAKSGLNVVLLDWQEGRDPVGDWFEFDRTAFDRFSPGIESTDSSALGLIRDLGLAPELRWRTAAAGNKWFPWRKKRSAFLNGGSVRLTEELFDAMKAMGVEVRHIAEPLLLEQRDESVHWVADGREESFGAMLVATPSAAVDRFTRGRLAQVLEPRNASQITSIAIVSETPVFSYANADCFVSAHSGSHVIHLREAGLGGDAEIALTALRRMAAGCAEFQPSAVIKIVSSRAALPEPRHPRLEDTNVYYASSEVAAGQSWNAIIECAQRAADEIILDVPVQGRAHPIRALAARC